ncbi:hypothetical protein SAMN05216460_1022 [Streptococcus sp. 45]|uniref:Uncharacterized protein n=1 Tax=Streptococcus equinus TaxID=1335 RepID=A0A1H0MBN6_STREI|nr:MULTISPECIES: hypothetical protein [Streptococcus]SDO77626.1 hypothetical protein SAMN05216347_102270 [Streptococcus equinus]SEI61616.1 hypothetical protein SAMN05216460_1022 [Streptococcus sp. 45]
MSKSKKQEVIILERYHGPLITNGVELGYIKIVPWLNLVADIFWYFAAGYNDNLGILKGTFLLCILINLFSILYSFFNYTIVKHKVLTYLLLTLNFLTMIIWLNFIGLMMFVSNIDDSMDANTFYDSPLTMFYVIPMIALFVIMIFFVYPYFYRRDRRTNGAYREKESKFNSYDNKMFSSKFLIIFGLVVFVPPLLTGYIENAFGLFSGFLFTSTLSALVVDSFYAALYAKQHPEEIDEL